MQQLQQWTRAHHVRVDPQHRHRLRDMGVRHEVTPAQIGLQTAF